MGYRISVAHRFYVYNTIKPLQALIRSNTKRLGMCINIATPSTQDTVYRRERFFLLRATRLSDGFYNPIYFTPIHQA